LDAELKVLGLRGFKGDGEKLVDNGGVDSGNGVAKKYNEHLLRAHIEKRSQGDLGLVGKSLCLIEDDHFWASRNKECIKGGPNKGVDAAADSFKAAFVTGVQEEGATKEGF